MALGPMKAFFPLVDQLARYFLAVRSAISLAISSFVLPSVVMPKLFAASINGSVVA